MKKINFKKFFTLIELILVIVVLGILAAIVIPNISSFKEEAKETAMISDGRNIQTAIDMYQLDNNGDYPIISENKPSLGKPADVDFNLLNPEYLRDLPQHNGMHYQVDYQGQIYFSAIDNPTDFERKPTSLTWTPNDKATGYDIHEVVNGTTSASNGTQIKLVAANVQGGTFTPEDYNPKNTYLINVIDQHGFKAAPVLEGYTGSVPFNKDDIKGITPPSSIEPPMMESELDQLVLGDFVQFGKHLNGDPMKWNVVKKENGEVMLFMSESLKDTNAIYYRRTFDVSPNPEELTDSNRDSFGSNNWEYSDIRTWLNNEFYNTVFERKDLIANSTHEYVLAGFDSSLSTSGTENHLYNYNFSQTLTNYDSAYKKSSTDKVFLINIHELVNYVQPSIGNNYFNSSYHYWVRDSHTIGSFSVRRVYMDGTVRSTYANDTSGRIRAAIHIQTGTFSSGDGSINNPYVIE